MKQYIPQEFSTKLIGRSSFVIMRNTMPPRYPDEDKDEDNDEADDTADEPPVVRRTMTRIACGCRSAYSISHELGCEKRSAA
jgi:hypothetical protein